MPIYLFKAVTVHPQTKQPIQLPVGARSGFVVTYPGNIEACKHWLRANSFGSSGVRYIGMELPHNLKDPEVLSLEINLGMRLPAAQPQLAGAHVNGGQPVGSPVGSPAQNRPTGVKDSSGFQTLGDDVLSGAGDALFGDQNDGTVTDLYGGGHFEAPRAL